MATDTDINTVERVIGYRFKRRSLISQALTAAGAEEDNYDGNRKLSQIGASHVDVLLAFLLFDTGVNRGKPGQQYHMVAVM
jgi:dsRNA-specific ribonuclease